MIDRQRNMDPTVPLKSTTELGYLDSATVCIDNRYTELGSEL
ncbi:unnamed protein product, partial [Rotaria sp. Silwood2]